MNAFSLASGNQGVHVPVYEDAAKVSFSASGTLRDSLPPKSTQMVKLENSTTQLLQMWLSPLLFGESVLQKWLKT